jgi:hypothetical protein
MTGGTAELIFSPVPRVFLGMGFFFYRERSERDERENTAGTAMVPAPGKTKSIKSLLTMKRR